MSFIGDPPLLRACLHIDCPHHACVRDRAVTVLASYNKTTQTNVDPVCLECGRAVNNEDTNPQAAV